MAPGYKRKRGDGRNYSQDDDAPNRPSPHRPQPMRDNLAQNYSANSPRGGRRGSRNNSNRGANNTPQSPGLAQPSPTMPPPANTHQSSRSGPATPSNTAPPRLPPPNKPRPNLEAMEINDHLTVERVTKWTTEARDELVQVAIRLQLSGDMAGLSLLFHEIIEASIKQYMDPAELGLMVRDIVHAPTHENLDSITLFLDCVATATVELTAWDVLKKFLIETDIPLGRMRSILEAEQLIGMGLVRTSFNKMAVRKTTDAIYRQANYNLLREESEGFSKLMTEYFTTVSNEPPTADVCSETYQRVNAFIGSFDLDVGRTLDVTLDVFANLLVKHCKFFVKFLRASAWWPVLQGTEGRSWEEPVVQPLPGWVLPDSKLWYYTDKEKEHQLELREARDNQFWRDVAELESKRSGMGLKVFFALGARKVTGTNTTETEAAQSSKKNPWANTWIAETGTLPPLGNDIAAQLLGFKLQFYAANHRDDGDVLPDNLIYLAALLIKIGFISILDLWPHLYPLDESMPAHKLKLEQEKAEREAKEKKARGGTNALEMAGALPDDTPQTQASRLREAESKPSSKPESERTTPVKPEDETNSLPEPADQKVALLRSLLCIGAIPEALFILGRFPWLLDLYPDLHTYILRLAHHSLSKVYESSRPVPLAKIPVTFKGVDSNIVPRPGNFQTRRVLRWPKLDQKDAGEGVDYRFYWEDWMDNVPVCQTVDDVFLLCSTWLSLIGPECGKDVTLLTKLARIGKKSLTDQPSDDNRKRWMGLSASLLVPALTFTGQNPGVVNETWELLRHFDTAERYTIYSNWFRSTKPVMRNAFKTVTDETKRLLSRVAATNTRPMGRAMAKLACPCPGTVFELTLKQGQSYINMIDALVECSRYLTPLGYDCLTWTLVDSLLKNDRSTLQGDGMLVKGWLKHTAIFIGKVYKRYSYMNATPVLQLVKEQVFRPEGELFMLVVLEQLLTTMGGIGLSGALTEARVLALSAGPALRAYTLEHHLGDRRHEGKFASRRLLRCLDQTKDSDESALAPEILIALAQQVMSYPFRPELKDVPDKVVFTNYDKLRSNFAQFIDFLRENLTVREFDTQTPGVVELMSDFGLDPNVAFQISRVSVAAKVNAARITNYSTPNGTPTDGDVTMGGTDNAVITNGVATPPVDPVHKASSNEVDVEMKDATSTNPLALPRSNHEIDAIVGQLKTALPDKYGSYSFLNFFVTFWTLDLKDVLPIEHDELKKQYEDAKEHIKKKVPERFNQRQAKEECERLSKEYQQGMKTAQLTQAGLSGEMQQWFSEVAKTGQTSAQLHDKLLQDCFFPRLRTSLQDAQFSSTMLFFMHRTGVPAFRLPKFLDQLFIHNRIANMILMMSEEEAKCLGRFINDILRELQRWHEDKKLYEKCALGDNQQLPGFSRSFNPDGTPSTFLDYDQFRILHCKWHVALCSALKSCLKSGQYTEYRNSVSILKAVSPAFPKVDHMAADLRQFIEGYAKDDDRDDVKVAANSLLFEFKKSAKTLKTESFFRTGVNPPVNNAAAPSRTTSEQPKTPQPPETATKKLNAAVPVFKPKNTEVNGQSKPAPANNGPGDQKPAASTISAPSPRMNGKDVTKPLSGPSESNTTRPPLGRPVARPDASQPSPIPANAVPSRPDSQNTNQPTNSNRPPHSLPTRPDPQPPRSRQPERPNDRAPEYRPSPASEYGRLDRSRDGIPRDGLPEREITPSRRRSRSPLRGPNTAPDRRAEWANREARDYEDRALRPPLRDARGPHNRATPYGDSPRDPRDPRDVRDQRDYREREPLRERLEPRPPPPPSHLPPADGRGRMHASPMLSNDAHPHRREAPPNALHAERGGALPPRPPINATPPANDRAMINPERAALIDDDRVRMDPPRYDRDARHDARNEGRRDEPSSRRDRGSRPQSRPQSPRRDERSSAAYHSSDARRDYREERLPPHPATRERRDEAVNIPPTGPRGGRDAMAASISRDMFQPSQPPRVRAHPSQDPNYGRLNQPVDAPPPSGPRHPASDRRDTQNHNPVAAPPTAPAAQQAGIHPSRISNIRGPPLQTDVPAATPSGPRGSARTPQQPIPSPSTRNPPTGPASAERGPRHANSRNPVRDINTVLSANAQNTPPTVPPSSERPPERSSRRGEQARRERSRTPDRRGDDRSRGEKRERSRRDPQEPREPREPRESRDGRERSDRDRERERKGDDRDRRSRGGGGDDTRDRGDGKRRRDTQDQPHGETKRSRR
ncbi:hypothetical protein CC80DRAFT_560920 [Byssothecium circinans]|uniref:THO complex subunit 2 n=1 Tax=Byssothecium circinans TaxID=147558 RepID=A0A6A5U8W4_9PLEO|nr:hypothetical protein CC80DRAFT_560920 [Byssothecium circinans]